MSYRSASMGSGEKMQSGVDMPLLLTITNIVGQSMWAAVTQASDFGSKHNTMVYLQLHEAGELNGDSSPLLLQAVQGANMSGKVTASRYVNSRGSRSSISDVCRETSLGLRRYKRHMMVGLYDSSTVSLCLQNFTIKTGFSVVTFPHGRCARMERKMFCSLLLAESNLYHLMELKSPKPLLCIREPVDHIRPLDFLMLMDSPDDSPYFSSENSRANMLSVVVDNLQGYANIYEGFKSFPKIFTPISNLLSELVGQDHMPVVLKDKMKATVQLIEKKTNEHHTLRRPLQMRKQKPVPIKLLNSKFEEVILFVFVSTRDYDPDRQRAEDRKLKKLVKRKAKGVTRELRKDNYFLAEAKARDKAHLDAEKAKEHGRARAFLQEQEHAFKYGQLGKSRKRRR
ncbi:nucleolar protein 14 [Tanacetum coccineum]